MSRGLGARQRAILGFLNAAQAPADLHTIIAAIEGSPLRCASHTLYSSYLRALRKLIAAGEVARVGKTGRTGARSRDGRAWPTGNTWASAAKAIHFRIEELEREIERDEAFLRERPDSPFARNTFLPMKRRDLDALKVESLRRRQLSTLSDPANISVEASRRRNLSTLSDPANVNVETSGRPEVSTLTGGAR